MKLRIKTPSRLHLGLIDLRGDLGRAFGSVGVGIRFPNVILEAEAAGRLEVEGEQAERFKEYAERYIKATGAKTLLNIRVEKAIPAHVGLGSGTQSALAVASAINELNNLNYTAEKAAILMGRASISSVGIGVFKHGGFIVDAGHRVAPLDRSKKERGSIAPIFFRHPFPEDWLFVVAIVSDRRGLSGSEERKAFDGLPLPKKKWASDACRLVHLNIIPALLERDIETFGRALTNLQKIVGRSFEAIQGGIFASREVEECCRRMLRAGAKGVGQSSWGPTVYGLTEGIENAKKVMRSLEPVLGSMLNERAFIVRGDNRGARIKRVV